VNIVLSVIFPDQQEDVILSNVDLPFFVEFWLQVNQVEGLCWLLIHHKL